MSSVENCSETPDGPDSPLGGAPIASPFQMCAASLLMKMAVIFARTSGQTDVSFLLHYSVDVICSLFKKPCEKLCNGAAGQTLLHAAAVHGTRLA